MKVLVINDFSQRIGGAERLLESILENPDHGNIQYDRIDVADILPPQDYSWSHAWMQKFRRFQLNKRIMDAVSNRIHDTRPDLIFVNNNNLFSNSITTCLRQFDIPVLCFIHDRYSLYKITSAFYHFSRQYTFLTHAPEIFHRLLRLKKKAYLVKVPFHHQKWQKTELEKPVIPVTDLLYVGRMEKHKGVFTLIRAIERIVPLLPAIKLVMLGTGSKHEAIEKWIRKKGLGSNIELKGMQQDDEILYYYCNSRLLILPSRIESLGYVGLEAQSCGLPVISFENQGTLRWCANGQNGFMVTGYSSRNLADKILEVIHNQELLDRIALNAQKDIALEKYNATAQEIRDLYTLVATS